MILVAISDDILVGGTLAPELSQLSELKSLSKGLFCSVSWNNKVCDSVKLVSLKMACDAFYLFLVLVRNVFVAFGWIRFALW